MPTNHADSILDEMGLTQEELEAELDLAWPVPGTPDALYWTDGSWRPAPASACEALHRLGYSTRA